MTKKIDLVNLDVKVLRLENELEDSNQQIKFLQIDARTLEDRINELSDELEKVKRKFGYTEEPIDLTALPDTTSGGTIFIPSKKDYTDYE